MTILSVQRGIEALYRLPPGAAVTEFLIDDEARESLLGPRQTPEQLLVHQDDDDVSIGLYLREDVAGIGSQLRSCLQLGNQAFGMAMHLVEGVSHFVMALWCGSHGRQVSALELELQAEVDKFATAYLEGGIDETPALLRRLFDDYELMDDLAEEEVARYEAANSLAKRYATSLASRFDNHASLPAMLVELRSFYRLPMAAKVARARGAGCS